MKKRYIILFCAVLFGIVAFIVVTSLPTQTPMTDMGAVTGGATSDTSGLTPEPAPVAGHDRIVVTSPVMGKSSISSPLMLTGEAAGWYFEGSFPVDLTDDTGKIIAQGYVTAQGDWMTSDFVPFKGTLEFTVPSGVTHGYLVFKKDNPSDNRQLDDSFSLPVIF
ncbi:Gmad2 immunoglobulin-like domain-containing protein [Patescibacteria group bacterium]|nr:Gmad2 immunoglobulin-like domain-containing protein [Patescibacteria group bacterium]